MEDVVPWNIHIGRQPPPKMLAMPKIVHQDCALIDALYHQAAATLHPGLASSEPADEPARAAGPPIRVLFLCTQNSARSQMAEALLRHLAGDQVVVASAGTEPGVIHPLALQTLAAHGVDTTGLVSKHLDTFAGQDFDAIVTVCDRARESCPIFPGDPERIHWSFADPAAIADPTAAERAFEQTFVQLQTRLRYLVTLLQRGRGDQ